MNDNKLKRIDMIIKEAAEQSWRYTLPIVTFENNLI
jgi:16S rRNA U1498 N3-methylase RsmE